MSTSRLRIRTHPPTQPRRTPSSTFVPIVPHPTLSRTYSCPAHPAHKTHRYLAEEPIQVAYASPSTSRGPSRTEVVIASDESGGPGMPTCPESCLRFIFLLLEHGSMWLRISSIPRYFSHVKHLFDYLFNICQKPHVVTRSRRTLGVSS